MLGAAAAVVSFTVYRRHHRRESRRAIITPVEILNPRHYCSYTGYCDFVFSVRNNTDYYQYLDLEIELLKTTQTDPAKTVVVGDAAMSVRLQPNVNLNYSLHIEVTDMPDSSRIVRLP